MGVHKVSEAVQRRGTVMCPACGLAGVPSTDLLITSMLGSELPLDFEIYCCPQKHYWRIWDDGTVDPIIPDLQV